MLLQTMVQNITQMVDSAVIKYNKLALDNETTQSLRVADYYISAVEKTSSFWSYDRFSVEAIINAGIPTYDTNDDDLKQYTAESLAMVKELIPEKYRHKVVEEQRKLIISDFEAYGDNNNYYRQLSGRPDMDTPTSEYVYLKPSEYDTYGLPSYMAVHEFDLNTQILLDTDGVIDRLISENPDKPYLQHMGLKKIDPFKARNANNFTLLYVKSEGIPLSVYDNFTRIYEQNREYICTTLYNRNFADSYPLYDNFMALCIMIMTVQRMFALSFKQGISRDLYDWEFIQNLYASYNIPFNESLSIDTHITLVKNFNYLLRHKSTDKVLFDLASLLGYANIDFEKYYLVKDHKFDENGNPLFVYTTDEDGNTVPDYKAMYNLYFKTVNLKEKNVILALQNSSSTKSYEEVTENDPYWWDAGDLKESLLKEDFNYYESKYITLNMMYKMTEIMFDISYSLHMIFDQKDNIKNYLINVALPKVDNDQEFSLFDTAIFIIAGLCKLNGFTGNIPTEASDINHIYAFRKDAYSEDRLDGLLYRITGSPAKPDHSGAVAIDNSWDDRYKEAKNKYPDPTPTYQTQSGSATLDNGISDSWEITSAEEFNTLFARVKDFKDDILNAMWEATDVNQYTAYKAIYDIYMTKSAVDETFTKSDGTIASTYLDYLHDTNITLYSAINNTEGDDLYDLMVHAVSVLEDAISNIQHMHTILDDNDTGLDSLVALVTFFKSYTVDVPSFNVWYILGDKHWNSIRFFDALTRMDVKAYPRDELDQIYGDNIHEVVKCNRRDQLTTRETISFKWEGE